MSSTTTENADDAASSSRSTATRVISTIEERVTDGSLAVLAGGATFGLAFQTFRRSKARAALLALAAAGLVGLGARQLRAEGAEADVETGADARRDEDGEKQVSDSAHAQGQQTIGAGRIADETRGASQSESEPNPRGMSDRDDVETDDGGDVDFVEGNESGAGRKPHLEDETAHDPRLHPDSDEESTRIDLSETAMTDEASEATGPQPEQAYPAQEGTDPEPSAAKAPERIGDGAAESDGSAGSDRSPEDEAGGARDGGDDASPDGETADEPAESADEDEYGNAAEGGNGE